MVQQKHQTRIASLLVICKILMLRDVASFQPRTIQLQFHQGSSGQTATSTASALFLAKGFGTSQQANKKKPKAKDIQKNLKKRYGGTTPEAIAKGTQQSMEMAMQQLPPHIQRAAHLYQTIRQWDAYVNRLSIIQQQRSVDETQVKNIEMARTEYQRLCDTHMDTVSDRQMHELFQKLTWDASADAKAARVLMGGATMKSNIKERIQTACKWAKEAVDDTSICLDVGCGYGAIVHDLIEAGMRPDQIYGIDLSSEMIRNAKSMYDTSQFKVASFYDFDEVPPNKSIGAIIFCSALHDMPDIPKAIEHAASLLLFNKGQSSSARRLVIVHAQGAQHVISQVEANPVLVARPLPDESELAELAKRFGMVVKVAPAAAATPRDVEDGYLAVLETV